MCCMVTMWKPHTWQMCVGRLCSGNSVCGVAANGKRLSFASVCVWTCLCVVWSKAEIRLSSHGEKNDRIWFCKPICKKMKATKLVKFRAETFPDLPERFHCSIRWSVDGHQVLLRISSQLCAATVIWMPPLLLNMWYKGSHYKPNLGLVPNNTEEKQNGQ